MLFEFKHFMKKFHSIVIEYLNLEVFTTVIWKYLLLFVVKIFKTCHFKICLVLTTNFTIIIIRLTVTSIIFITFTSKFCAS